MHIKITEATREHKEKGSKSLEIHYNLERLDHREKKVIKDMMCVREGTS